MKVVCPQCGIPFKRIGSHWAQSSDCDYPSLSDEQRKIVQGLMIGGGGFSAPTETSAAFQLASTEREYVEWLFEELGIFSLKIEEIDPEDNDRDFHAQFSESESPTQYQTVHRYSSRYLPEFKQMRSRWHSDGGRSIPTDVAGSDTLHRALFSLCGHVQNRDWGDNAGFTLGKTRPSDTELERVFDRYETIIERSERALVVRITGAERFFDNIGRSPVPGAESRWGAYSEVST